MDPLTVCLGCQVDLELHLDEEPELLTLTVVPDAQADYYAGFLGESTPLAKAILGQAVGAAVPYQDGRVIIRSIRIADLPPEQAKENAAKRQEQLEQTHKEIAKTNAILFSLTVESKWGDYDPDGIEW